MLIKMIYGNLHRLLLRSVASRGVVTMMEAENIIKTFADETEHSIQDLIKIINSEIRPFQQTIKITNDELTDEKVLIFLSLGFDDAAKAQNIFSANELELFRLLIEEIMTTEARQITGIHAINLVGKMKGSFSKTDAQKLLKTWCRMHYLDVANNNYALGVRAIHEFESYLRQNMPDTIEECCLCKQIVFRGCNCPACALAVHTRCLNMYLQNISKWPCCKIDYDPEQLERHQRERLSHSRRHNTTEMNDQSEVYNTVVEPTMDSTQETTSEEVDLTQQSAFGISQSATRKRKRQRQ